MKPIHCQIIKNLTAEVSFSSFKANKYVPKYPRKFISLDRYSIRV